MAAISRKACKHFLGQRSLACLSHCLQARANSAARDGDLLVRSAFDPLLKVHKPRIHKYGMRVRVDESGNDYFCPTIDLRNFLAILVEPWIAEGVFGYSDSDDLAADAQNGSVVDDAELFEIGRSSRADCGRRTAQG